MDADKRPLRFLNGASVSRVYNDQTSEVLAEFQYDSHACFFAKTMAEDTTQPRNTMFAVVDHYAGNLRFYRQPEEPRNDAG